MIISSKDYKIQFFEEPEYVTKQSEKIENVIMEASSHGLHQNRLDGLFFNSAIFTNLSQYHLYYHKNFKNYLNAKLYLFQNLIKKGGFVITDDKIPE